MTFSEMKLEVAAFMNRDPSAFTIGSTNMLNNAVNKARKFAELRHNFEYNRTQVKIPTVSLSTGGLLSTAVDNADGVTPVSVKLVERAFLALTNVTTPGTFPVEFQSREAHQRRVRRRFEDATTTNAADLSVIAGAHLSVVQQGQTIYVVPRDSKPFAGATEIPVYLDIVRWRPDYSADGDTDFFLNECREFMLYRSVYQLNLFLKEDQRVPISKDSLAESWDTVLSWDKSLVAGTVDDVSLD